MSTSASNDDADDVNARLTAARARFLEASNAYGVKGHELERRVLEQLAPYHDSAQNRAPIIQDFARELSHEIKRFSTTRAFEMTGLAMVYLNAFAVAQSATLAGLTIARDLPIIWADESLRLLERSLTSVAGLQGAPDSTSAVDTDSLRKGLDELQGILLGAEEMAAWGFGVARASLLVRQAALDGYLGSVPLVEHVNPTLSFFKALVAEAPLAGFEIAGDAMLAAIPLGTIAVSILNAAKRVREKVNAMNENYKRGSIDELFDFGQALYDEREVHQAVSTFLDTLSTNLTALDQALKVVRG